MQAKGTNFINIKSFVSQQLGEAEWARVLEELGDADGRALREVVAVGWYDFGLQLRLLHKVVDLRGEPVIAQFGQFDAEEDLTKIHRLFLRLANPAFVLEKSGEYWKRFYSSGHWVVTREGPQGATAVMREVEPPDAMFCRYLTAYIARMFELVGAKDPAVKHPECRGRGDERCVFVGSWS